MPKGRERASLYMFPLPNGDPWWKGGQESPKTLLEVITYLCGKYGTNCLIDSLFSGTAERNVEGER
jgi:hypothetical protein